MLFYNVWVSEHYSLVILEYYNVITSEHYSLVIFEYYSLIIPEYYRLLVFAIMLNIPNTIKPQNCV